MWVSSSANNSLVVVCTLCRYSLWTLQWTTYYVAWFSCCITYQLLWVKLKYVCNKIKPIEFTPGQLYNIIYKSILKFDIHFWYFKQGRLNQTGILHNIHNIKKIYSHKFILKLKFLIQYFICVNLCWLYEKLLKQWI